MADELQEFAEHLRRGLGARLMRCELALGELTATTSAAHIVSVLRFLKEDSQCDCTQLMDICGVDYPARPARFELVYHLLSLRQNRRVRVKLAVGEHELVPSATELFAAANWYEREAFDLYGILFSNHPDLRRLLTDYNFSGHPLRKDFPLTGHVERRYDEALGRVVYEPVQLVQDFRDFDFVSPWEGALPPAARKAHADRAEASDGAGDAADAADAADDDGGKD